MRHLGAGLALIALFAAATARADVRASEGPGLSNEAVLAEASAAFSAGARLAAQRPAEAAAAMAPAVTAYRRLIEERGLHSAGLMYNLGNAYYLSNDLGRAVLWYRRAQRLDASLPGLSGNLQAARAKVGFRPAPAAPAAAPATRFPGAAGAAGAPGGVSGVGTVFAWHTLIAQPVRVWVAAGAFGGVWLVLLARLIAPRVPRDRRPPLWLAGACAAVAGLSALSLWWQDRAERLTPAGVVVADRVVGRKGPDELGYQPSFTEPLRAGFEVHVLERRGDWLSVRLGDGRVTWVPASGVETL